MLRWLHEELWFFYPNCSGSAVVERADSAEYMIVNSIPQDLLLGVRPAINGASEVV